MTGRIDIVVQSKYPEILDRFKKSFYETTEQFKNLKLHVFPPDMFGAKEINKKLIEIIKSGSEVFGVFNDDVKFSYQWLEDSMKHLKDFSCVSPGYIETTDKDKFFRAIALTSKIEGTVPNFYGPVALWNTWVFKRIGIFDERFDWSCDDLDWAWRLKLNGMPSATSKRITVMHEVGATRKKEVKKWNSIWKQNKQRFYDKHGYTSYRDIRSEYLTHHSYFSKFR